MENTEVFPVSLRGQRIGRRASYPSGLCSVLVPALKSLHPPMQAFLRVGYRGIWARPLSQETGQTIRSIGTLTTVTSADSGSPRRG